MFLSNRLHFDLRKILRDHAGRVAAFGEVVLGSGTRNKTAAWQV